MTFVLATSFSTKASGKSTCAASAGVWAAGGAASIGKLEPARYAAVRVGAGADTQTVGLRGKFKRVVQLSAQPDGFRAARSSRRLAQR
jgi:hypothetical protein